MDLKSLFQETKTIAIVGLSDKPNRPSYRIASYLQANGFRIVPVNPGKPEILGEKSYASIKDIPFPIDMVNVFRKSEDCLEVAEDAVAISAKSLWLQLGIINLEAEKLALKNGLIFIMDRCIKVDHQLLM
jgi:hypothetical protein